MKTLIRSSAFLCVVLVSFGLSSAAFGQNCSAPANAIEAENCLPGNPPSQWDVSGAGDSFFMSCGMALRVGADIWQSSYLGALAAALQVSRLGNVPLTVADLVAEIDETGFSHD